MRDSERKLNRLLDELKRKAEQFVSERAEQIVKYRRPGANVVQVSPGRFELQGVDGVNCRSCNEREAWIQAANLIDKRNEPELRVARELFAAGSPCSGLMKPDTHLGENARQIEVSDDQTTSFLFR